MTSPAEPSWGHRVRTAAWAVGEIAVPLYLGTWGCIAAIREQGRIVVFAPVQEEGIRAILGVSLVFLVAARLLQARPMAVHAVRLVAVVAVVAGTADNVGRAQGIAAIASVLVAQAAVGTWRPTRRWPARSSRVAFAALVPVVLAQWLWLRTDSLLLVLVLDALGLVVVELHHRAPAWWDARYGSVRTAAFRVAGASAASARRGASAARRTGSRVVRWCRGVPPAHVEMGLACLVTAVLMAPVLHRYSTLGPALLGSNDYQTHLTYSESGSIWPLRVPVPHPGFHMSVVLFRSVLGTVWASTLVLTAASVAATVLIVGLSRRPFAGDGGLPRWWGLGFAVAAIFADTPALVAQALHVGSPWDWAPAARMVLSPTEMLLFPLSLALVVRLGRAFDQAGPIGRREGGVLALLVVAASLVKPSATLILLPATAVLVVASRRPRDPLVRDLATWLFLPSLVVLLWQYWFLVSGPSSFVGSEIVLRPFQTIRDIGLDRTTPLLYSHLVVALLALWADARSYLRERTIVLTLVSLAIGLVLLVLFAELGPREGDGNMAKPAFLAAALLYLFSWRFVLGRWLALRTGERLPLKWRAWRVATVAFGALSLLAGTIGYLHDAGLLDLPTRGGGA